jgi:hypothetical protein
VLCAVQLKSNDGVATLLRVVCLDDIETLILGIPSVREAVVAVIQSDHQFTVDIEHASFWKPIESGKPFGLLESFLVTEREEKVVLSTCGGGKSEISLSIHVEIALCEVWLVSGLFFLKDDEKRVRTIFGGHKLVSGTIAQELSYSLLLFLSHLRSSDRLATRQNAKAADDQKYDCSHFPTLRVATARRCKGVALHITSSKTTQHVCEL